MEHEKSWYIMDEILFWKDTAAKFVVKLYGPCGTIGLYSNVTEIYSNDYVLRRQLSA